jgi:hypothetical protein
MSHLSVILLRKFLHTLGAVLAISLLLCPLKSFAATTPTYFACSATATFGILECTSPWEIIQGSQPNPSFYISTLIGDVNTTAVAGTQAAYLACSIEVVFGVTKCSGQYQIFLGAAPNPSTYISWLIGYPYTSQVAGTSATYLACTLQTVIGITSCSNTYQILQGFTPNPSVYQTWLIGYITP